MSLAKLQQYQNQQRRLRNLEANGRRSDRAAEAVRERLEQLWHELTQAEREQVRMPNESILTP
jgi:hypothetical protein